MSYAGITDPTNPFNERGISDEDRALLNYLVAAKAATGVDVVVTCTTDHPAGTTQHLQTGTNGVGLAVDCRMRKRGLDTHRAVFNLFASVERQLFELIYADAPYNVKAGRRVAPYAVADHHDHVHVAVNRGVFLRWPVSLPQPPTPVPPTPAPPQPPDALEDDMLIAYIDNGPAYLITGGVKILIHGSEIAGLKAVLPVVHAPHLIEATPDAQ